MNNFFALFAQHSSRPDFESDPDWADREFPTLVAASPFRLWRPNDPIPAKGRRLLLGVATWSGYDMRLLDVLAESVKSAGRAKPIVDLFDVAMCKEKRDFAAYFPDRQSRHSVQQTPVVGVWEDGVFAEDAAGYQARELVARMVGSSSAEIVEYVDNWIKSRSLAEGA